MAGGVNCGKLDLTKISQDEIITINDRTWVKNDVDEKIYIINNKPHVVIKFSDTCVATVCDDQKDLKRPLANQAGVRQANQQTPPPDSCDTSQLNCSQSATQSLPSSINSSTQSVTQAQRSVDANSIDIYSWHGSAVKPASAIIAMKSNIRTYGPYASSNFATSCGGTQVESNTDLAPWVFGSTAAMNSAGASIVESTAIGLVKAETGNITVPGLPGSDFDNLGAALSGGPNLSSINFSYGSNGISTSYEFRTYTPKFGNLNRHLTDRVKSIAKNRTEQLRFLRNNQITQNKISRKLRNIAVARNNNMGRGGTLQRMLVGEIYNWQSINNSYTQCTIVGLDTLRKSVGEMTYDYDKKAYISLDGLFGPVSIGGDGGLPRFAQASTDPYKQSLSKNPYPPFLANSNQINNLNIDKEHLNPLTNKVDTNNHHHNGTGTGHVIDAVGRATNIPDKGLITNFYGTDDESRYSDDYRFLAMRGPLVLHSWGYDTDGKPIPNEADNDSSTKLGSFTTNGLKDRFLENWLGKPATWPVAPVDLRFDRNRGVWVSPPGPSIIIATLDSKLDANSSCQASIVFDDAENKIYDKDGNIVTNGKIIVYDKLGCTYNENTKIYAYFNTCLNKYIILESCNPDSYCPPSSSQDAFTIGKLDLQTIPGWNKTVEQVLGHNENGCLKWFDTTTCESSPSSSS
jgi:hypothetical protein